MKKIKNINWILISILLVASIFRLWNLGNNPPHLTPDEASLGYNAYSILKTGKDEYGKVLPVVFKSFGDYKPGLYVYFTVPFVGIFGLTEFATRFASSLSGIISVYLIFLIVKKMFIKNELLAYIAAFVASTNPWLIFFSRGAWEVNLALSLTLCGIYLFLKSLDDSKYLIYSAIPFALTLLTYQGAKISTTIVLLVLTIIYWKNIVGYDRSNLIKAFLVGFVISIPIFLSFVNGETGRLNVFSVFSYPRSVDYIKSMLDEGSEKIGDINYYLFHPESLNFLRGIMGRWFNHFSGRFLFFEGDWANPRHSSPNQGVLLFSDLLFLLIGVFAIIKNGTKNQNLFVWLWLVLAPLASALSRDQVHAVRSLGMAIPLIIIISLGVEVIAKYQSKKIFKAIIFAGASFVYLFGIIYYIDSYFVHLPAHDSAYWEYGYKQMVMAIKPIQKNYKEIKIQQSFAQPYIYFLFFGGEKNGQGYDPAKYQKDATWVASENKGDVGYVVKLDNICFCAIDWSVNRGDHGVLFAADTLRIPPGDSNDPVQFNIISDIKFLNGRDTAFRVLEIK